MPLDLPDDGPLKFPSPDFLTIDSHKKGVITLIDKSRLPRDALSAADNIFLYEDGQAGPRPGVDWFGSPPGLSLDTTVTNLVTNPDLETNSTGWSAFHATIARDSTVSYNGQYSLKATTTVATPDNPVAKYTVTGVTNGVTYRFGGYMKATAGDTIFTQSLDIAGSYNSMTATGGWDFIESIAGAVSGTEVEFEFGIESAAVNDVFYVDGAILQETSDSLEYFDGDTPDTNVITYAWTGTAHASTSTKATYVSSTIQGFEFFDFDGQIHIVAKVGSTIYRSTDDAETWEECTGATFTDGIWTNFNQNGNYLYITNGTDAMARYDGTTTLQTYTTLATPAAPTIVETGLSGTNYNYYYKCSRVSQVGFSVASAASSVVQSSLPRTSWDNSTNYATLTVPAYVTDQTRTDIYISTDDVDYYYLGSTTDTTFVDNGSYIPVPGTVAPTSSTATGPLVEELTNVGSRQYGVRDADNRYRIWFTGSANFSGSFSTAYDGGYLDWQEGGKYIPMKVVDYRDGKGEPYATVWCNSADGTGGILQMSLDTLTIGDISITVPSAFLLPGSRGTPSPNSVVNVLNDYYFYNSQAFYNLGSRAQFLNLLSTDEASANIRPTVKQISTEGEAGIAAIYHDAKVYQSVPIGSSTNNTTMVYDTEQKAWLPTAFTRGFRKFLRYTTADGTKRLLAVGDADAQLSEIGENIFGDYGLPFETNLSTGLYPVSKDRFQFQYTEEGQLDLARAQGIINVELTGIERKNGFSSIASKQINGNITSTGGHSTTFHSTTLHSDGTDAAQTYSEPSLKRYFRAQKELNAVQWNIYTNSLNARYRTRTFQTWGTLTQGGMPRQWRI